MKKTLLIAFSLTSIFSFGQGQIGNGDMESWETVSAGEEPVNWNSFKTAGGTWSGVSAVQIEQSTDVRPGSSGTVSCRIFSTETTIPFVGTIVANGNVTLGKINMGSTTPTDIENHNASVTADADFSEALTDTPDSLVFWAKYTPSSGSGNARMKATLHDNYDYQDPEDANSATHVVASAVMNYPNTNGSWMRISVPFDYSGPASNNTHLLVTFTTNETPGGGSGDDEVLIDDVELIYNTNSIDVASMSNTNVYVNNETNQISISSEFNLTGAYSVYNTNGQKIQFGAIQSNVDFNQPSGIYFLVLNSNGQEKSFKIVKF